MTVRQRIDTIRLLEKMNKHKPYCEKLGIGDASKIRKDNTTERKMQNEKKGECF